jgi:hypothetical protein
MNSKNYSFGEASVLDNLKAGRFVRKFKWDGTHARTHARLQVTYRHYGDKVTFYLLKAGRLKVDC